MAHIAETRTVEALAYQGPSGRMLLLCATGDVATSGWSGIRLSPRFYAHPPGDGVWEFDFEADAPTGVVLEVPLPVHAHATFGAPGWLQAVKVYAAENAVSAPACREVSGALSPAVPVARPRKDNRVLVRQTIATYDDAYGPVGLGERHDSIRMKKRRHMLMISVEGPDEARIRACLAELAGAGHVAAVVATYAMGGGGLYAAVSAALAYLQGILGPAFSARVDDRSYWMEWCT